MATWGDQTCQRFEATAVGFETGFSRLRVRPSNRYAIAPHIKVESNDIKVESNDSAPKMHRSPRLPCFYEHTDSIDNVLNVML